MQHQLEPTSANKPPTLLQIVEVVVRFVILLSLLAYEARMAITSRIDRGYHLSVLAIFGSLFVLALVAAITPNAPWVNFLFKRRFGPRTDTATMSKRECLQSGSSFLIWATIMLGVYVALFNYGDIGNRNTNPPVFVEPMCFAAVLLFLTTFVAAICLLLRGVFQKEKINSPAAPQPPAL